MKAALHAVLASLLLVLALGTTAAMATPPPAARTGHADGGPVECGNDQSATSDATSTQTAPSNVNIPVRVLSPGSDGSVSQSNDSTAAPARSTSTRPTSRPARAGRRRRRSPSRPPGRRTASEQSADVDGDVDPGSPDELQHPGSRAEPRRRRVGRASPTARPRIAVAVNANSTGQDIGQQQGGGGGLRSPDVQAAGQANDSKQTGRRRRRSRRRTTPTNIQHPRARAEPRQRRLGRAEQQLDGAGARVERERDRSGDRSEPGGGGCYGRAYVQAAGQATDNKQDADLDGHVDPEAPDQLQHPRARAEPRERRQRSTSRTARRRCRWRRT